MKQLFMHRRKILAILALVVVLSICLVQTSLAIDSIYTYFNANSILHCCYSEAAFSWDVSNNQDIAVGCGHIRTAGGGTVSAGYLGAQGKLYVYNGNNAYQHLTSSGLTFSNRVTDHWEQMVSTTRVAGINYCGKGYVEAMDNPLTGVFKEKPTALTAPITG